VRGSRNKLSEEVICALLRDFREHGQKAIAKVRRTQPAAYLKILALLVPREHKVEHSNAIKDMTTEQIERSIDGLGNRAKTVEAVRDELARIFELVDNTMQDVRAISSARQMTGRVSRGSMTSSIIPLRAAM